MELSVEQAAELWELVNKRGVPADMATRGRIVVWSGCGPGVVELVRELMRGPQDGGAVGERALQALMSCASS